jgi:hypothetical protein
VIETAIATWTYLRQARALVLLAQKIGLVLVAVSGEEPSSSHVTVGPGKEGAWVELPFWHRKTSVAKRIVGFCGKLEGQD